METGLTLCEMHRFDKDLEVKYYQYMASVNTQERIRKVEIELESLKRLAAGNPDFNVDEKNWAKAVKEAERTRKKNYRTVYGPK